ncbi:MAG: mycothiol synthase [Actinomycetes bacterium]
MTTEALRIERQARLSGAEADAVRALVAAAAEADGVTPLSEHVMLHMRYGGDEQVRNVLAWEGSTLVGYAHLDVTDEVSGASAELVVHPDHRRKGVGQDVASRLVAEAPDGRLRLWAHGQHPAAARLADRAGFVRSRALWQMRRSLLAPIPAPDLPQGVTMRTFRVGADEEKWTALNNRAFEGHPEQSGWSVDEVRVREREPWFDPEGFFLAEREGELVGFHWTKVHGGADEHDGHGHEPIGEVYVVGVDPAMQGSGLGRVLTVAGLRYLRSRGLTQAMLYVDEANRSAIHLYESLGFAHWDTDVSYARSE